MTPTENNDILSGIDKTKIDSQAVQKLLESFNETQTINQDLIKNLDGNDGLSEEEKKLKEKTESLGNIKEQVNFLENIVNSIGEKEENMSNLPTLQPWLGDIGNSFEPYNKKENKENIDKEAFYKLFDNIEENFNAIINNLDIYKSYSNNIENKENEERTKLFLEKAKEILKKDPEKIKIINKIGKEKYSSTCPSVENLYELLNFAFNLEYKNKLEKLKDKLLGITNNEGKNAYEIIKSKIKSNKKCDNSEIINNLKNNFNLNINQINDLLPIIGELKEDFIKNTTELEIAKILGINISNGNNLQLRTELKNLGIDYEDLMKNKNNINSNIFKNNKLKNLSNSDKDKILKILKANYETNLNAKTIQTLTKDEIEIYINKGKAKAQEIIDAKNSLGAIKNMLIEEPYLSQLNKLGIKDGHDISKILTNINEYNKLIVKFEEKKELDDNGIELLEMLKGIKDYIQKITELQDNSGVSLEKYVDNTVEFGKIKKDLDYGENNKEKSAQKQKEAETENISYTPTIGNYEVIEGDNPSIKLSGNKNIPITNEEAKMIDKNPESAENVINFYNFFEELNLLSVWKYRAELTKSIGDLNININDDFLKETEILKIGNKVIDFLNNTYNSNTTESNDKKEDNDKTKQNDKKEVKTLSKATNIDNLKASLREFSGSNSMFTDEKDFNKKGEDKFAFHLRNMGIIGTHEGFAIDKFRDNMVA